MVTSKFENLMSEEDKTIANFNAKLIGIPNQAFQHSMKCSDEKLVQRQNIYVKLGFCEVFKFSVSRFGQSCSILKLKNSC